MRSNPLLFRFAERPLISHLIAGIGWVDAGNLTPLGTGSIDGDFIDQFVSHRPLEAIESWVPFTIVDELTVMVLFSEFISTETRESGKMLLEYILPLALSGMFRHGERYPGFFYDSMESEFLALLSYFRVLDNASHFSSERLVQYFGANSVSMQITCESGGIVYPWEMDFWTMGFLTRAFESELKSVLGKDEDQHAKRRAELCQFLSMTGFSPDVRCLTTYSRIEITNLWKPALDKLVWPAENRKALHRAATELGGSAHIPESLFRLKCQKR